MTHLFITQPLASHQGHLICQNERIIDPYIHTSQQGIWVLALTSHLSSYRTTELRLITRSASGLGAHLHPWPAQNKDAASTVLCTSAVRVREQPRTNATIY
eukprot:scaffold73522_cov37-Prasinocladus_malaysianus.AAC.1